jgi:hypothetical protein
MGNLESIYMLVHTHSATGLAPPSATTVHPMSETWEAGIRVVAIEQCQLILRTRRRLMGSCRGPKLVHGSPILDCAERHLD